MKLRYLLLVIVLSGAFTSSAKALLPDYTFSFSDDTSNSYSTPGTVTGELFGTFSGDGSIYTPTDVVITSAPVALGFTTPTDLGTSIVGSFEVSGGQIVGTTNANRGIVAEDSNNDALYVNYQQYDQLYNETTSLYTGNTNGISGITFTEVPVPEPGGYGLFVFLAVTCLFGYRIVSRRLA